MTTFGLITPTVAVIFLVVALIIFGPGKLPELGKGLGSGIKEFRQATNPEDEGKGKTGENIKKEEYKV